MVLKRDVILKIYYMPNGLTSFIYKKIHQIFQGVRGRWKNDPRKILLKHSKERPSELEKGFSRDLVKQTVVTIPNTRKKPTLPCKKYQVILKPLGILNSTCQRCIAYLLFCDAACVE